MNLLQSVRMAVRSILAKKGRTALTVLSVFIGVMAVIVLVSRQQADIDQWTEYYKTSSVNRIDVYASMWGGKDITKELYQFCTGMTDLVDGVTPQQGMWGGNGAVKYGAKNFEVQQIIFGSDQYSVCTNSKVETGRDIAYMDIEKANRVCLIGSAVKELLFNFKNPIGEKITINNQSFTVIGVYAQKVDNSQWSDDNVIVVPYSLNRLLLKSTAMEQFIVKAKNTTTASKAVDKLKSFLIGKYKDRPYAAYHVSSANQYIEESNEQQQREVFLMIIIAGISLLVGGIGIMNIMLVSVTERTREIGIRKAIGAERRSIILQFLLEAVIVSALGGVVGVLFGILGTMVDVKLEFDKVFYPSTGLMALAFGISVGLGVLFGLYPAVKASRLQPVDALRNE